MLARCRTSRFGPGLKRLINRSWTFAFSNGELAVSVSRGNLAEAYLLRVLHGLLVEFGSVGAVLFGLT